MMENDFYVDNLLMTDGDLAKLLELYSFSREKLQWVGFNRSNCPDLKDKMNLDGNLSVDSSEWDKMLRYRYCLHLEEICVTPISMVQRRDGSFLSRTNCLTT